MRFLAAAPKETPAPSGQVPRKGVARASLILFILGFLTPVWIPFVWENSGQWAGVALLVFFLFSAAGTAALWLASIICGVVALQHRRYVLWWVIPSFLLLAGTAITWLMTWIVAKWS